MDVDVLKKSAFNWGLKSGFLKSCGMIVMKKLKIEYNLLFIIQLSHFSFRKRVPKRWRGWRGGVFGV